MRIPAFKSLVLCASLFVAGCGEQSAETPSENGTTETAVADKNAAASAMGAGTVTAVDAAAGKITLDHGPIPEMGWPAMTMTFDADPALLEGVRTGEGVRFEMRMENGAAAVTSIQRQ